MNKKQLKEIHNGLRTLHTLEIMAVNIYKYQISNKNVDLKPHLIAAMQNEMRHVEDFIVKLLEYGMKPSPIRWAYWIVGLCFGFGSRILGRQQILKTGIWVEKKAVHHYQELLDTIDWDEDTRPIVAKNQEDERHHIALWQSLLKK
ncbi:demethoxyubiquinone hydroxylase family protein [candidate division KSB1 bacterium]|nr:demethoxyubiquinone hydroxylase family protein [candidate division KSB1 bacterium]